MTFATAFDRPKTVPVCSGDKIRLEFALRHTVQGDLFLEKVADHDIQEEINSFLPQCDFETIVQRYEATGDPSFLNQKTGGFYGDFSQVPQTFADVIHGAKTLRDLYDRQDKSVFPSFDSFINTINDPKKASEIFADVAKKKQQVSRAKKVAQTMEAMDIVDQAKSEKEGAKK